MRIALLMTGTELMTGDIVDSNSAKVAEWLLEEGLSVAYKATIPDDEVLLVSEIERLSKAFDILLVNGGLGPTLDDLTAQALAKVLDLPIELHAEALKHLEDWCAARNYELSDENRKQVMLPKGIQLLPNEVGSAVGFTAEHNVCQIYCTPGVPHELAAMFKQSILPELSQRANKQVIRLRYRVFGYGESALQRLLSRAFPDWPTEIDLGFRASIPLIELKLSVFEKKHDALLEYWGRKVEELLGAHIISVENESLAETLVTALKDKQMTVTTAESCTGGKIASLITEVSGASSVFEASVVSYSNDIKQQILNVSESSLVNEGAVSEPVVREMLAGALRLSGADLGVAVSGVAGPSGGSTEKPVGTVWVAWGSLTETKSRCFYLPGNRLFFQQMVAAMALDLLRREVLQVSQAPEYFESRRLKPGN